MNRETFLSSLVWLLFVVLTASAFGQMPGYPAPRYPNIPNITSVEQLMPMARYVVAKPGDKSANLRPGFGPIKAGERILMALNASVDPMVTEALRRAFTEKGARVDILIVPVSPMYQEGLVGERANEAYYAGLLHENRMNRLVGSTTFAGQSLADNLAIKAFVEARKYDLLVGPGSTVGTENSYVSTWMRWFTREMLALTAAATFPEEVADLLDRKGWEIIRQTKTVHFTDPEGTDMKWSWFPEYWQIVEGTYPQLKTIGGAVTVGPVAGYKYGPGTSEDPLIPGHLMGVALGIALPQSDAEGVIVGTGSHAGLFPRIEIHVKNQQINQIKGGGEYGRYWREWDQKYKDVKYPLYPRAGHGFVVECSIGTNPKVARPYNVMEDPAGKSTWVDERRRSGIIHWGIGTILRENQDWALSRDIPADHFHIHQYFATYEATLQDGKKAFIIDKGRLTALDDPQVRQVAAKYGDPDELLREVWIPAIPGINVPGDYMKDYGQDPARWVTEEHRKAYAEAIARFNQRGYDIYK